MQDSVQVEKTDKTLWDWPVRIIHWSFVVLIPLAWWTAEKALYEYHELIGLTLITLVVTRIVWGLVGSSHARFSDFLTGPAAIAAYLRGQGARSPGHNPLGAWSVVVLLSLLLIQAGSGLFNTDDILFNAPLYYMASDDFRNLMGEVHDITFNALLGFVALHLAAVFYHQFKLKEKVLNAMVRGRADGREGNGRIMNPVWALLIAGAVAGLLWWGLSLAPQPIPIW
ncbi:MAG: cytochrome b/b6 domain-containing protein [Halioglobus sp.]